MMKNEGRKEIIVLGGGGHAKVVAGALQRGSDYDVVGFLDDNESKKELLKTPRLGNLLPANNDIEKVSLAIGMGHIGDTELRERVIEEYERNGYIFEQVIAPTAIISPDVTLGKGVVVFDGAVLQPGVTIGDYSIINTMAAVDHDCNVGHNVHIAPGATISGGVTIGNRVLIGIGASIIQGITIADDCIIGAGTVVIRDCDRKGGIYVGSPARLIEGK